MQYSKDSLFLRSKCPLEIVSGATHLSKNENMSYMGKVKSSLHSNNGGVSCCHSKIVKVEKHSVFLLSAAFKLSTWSKKSLVT